MINNVKSCLTPGFLPYIELTPNKEVAMSVTSLHPDEMTVPETLMVEYTLGLDGTETFDIALDDNLKPRQAVEVTAKKADGSQVFFTTLCRIDTPVEIDYYRNGGILHKVLRDLAKA